MNKIKEVLSKVVPNSDGRLAFATWAPDPQNAAPPSPQTLVVTRLRAGVDDFPQLLSSMLSFIDGLEIKPGKVEIWNLPAELEEIANSFGGMTALRTEHLSSIKVYRSDESWEWLFNEKCVDSRALIPNAHCANRYAWC